MSEATHGPVRDPQDLAQLLVSREHAGDADGMSALYEPDAILDIGNGQFARGREAIRRFYSELIATGRIFDLGVQRPAIVSGDLALTSTHLPNGLVTAEIARRQNDGTWLWVIDQPSIARYSSA
jgi:ketosteroid isomerase-like protein